MDGLLIVNNFVQSDKSSELYKLLTNAAKETKMIIRIIKTGEIPHNLDYIKSIKCDFVLFWDKDVLLAKMFEACGFKVFNSAASIFLCDNKAYTSLKLQQAEIKTPQTFVAPLTYESLGYNNLEFAESIAGTIGFPMIVKELYGSFGQQVYLVNNKQELDLRIKSFGAKGFLMQEFIECSAGRDIRINVVGNKVVSSMLRFSETGDFRSNISNGGNMKKYETNDEQKAVALNACKALGLDFAGVDVLFGVNDEPIVCEVNSNPHFKSSLDCTGIDMSKLILRHIKEKMLSQ